MVQLSSKNIKINFTKFILSVFFLGLFYSCTESNKDRTESEIVKDAMRNATSFFLIPDSLRTTEEKELYSKIESAVYESSTIQNDRFEITSSKEEWKKRGIPEIYFDIFKRDIDDMNKGLDTPNFQRQTVFDAFQKSKEEYFARKKTLLNNTRKFGLQHRRLFCLINKVKIRF